MKKVLLATVSTIALFGFAAAPSLAQDKTTVTIVKPDGTTVENAAETTGQAVENAAEATADAASDAAAATKDAASDAVAATKDAASDAAQATENAAETAGQKMESAAAATKDAADQTTVTVERTTADFEPANLETMLPAGSYLSSALMNEAVQTPDGDNIADTESLVLTPEGQVTHVIIGFGGFLGLGEKRVMLPWNAFSINPENQVFTVDLSEEQIKAMPEFEQTAAADK